MAKNKKGRKPSQKSKTSPNGMSSKKKSEAQKVNKRHSTLVQERSTWIFTGLATAGMILTGYLTISGWLNQAPVLCSTGSSCDVVQQTRWGTFLTLPIAFWGFLTYTTLFYIGIRAGKSRMKWKWAWTVALLGWGYSIYLISISSFVIQAVCFYCLASFILMTIIFGLVTFQRPKDSEKFKFAGFSRQTVVIAALFVGVMHLHYSGVFDPKAGPEDPFLKGLAIHLQQEQATVYGAYW
ncbi:MAG: vitamin K epoxide reductase family protein [Proteobacteria bacterium]|nr:vitamin K epoxide reductase family protein [Pseudomonadota bacterium]